MMRERLHRLRDDDGFTLVELVLTVAILGILSAALIGVVFQYLKVSGATGARFSESTDQQFVSTYWQADVSSLGRRTFDATSTTAPFSTQQSVFVGAAGPSGCGSSAGSVVVTFAWSEFASNAPAPDEAWEFTVQEVAYVTVSNSEGTQKVLKRVRCRDGVADQPLTVAHSLSLGTPPQVTCDTACGAAAPPNRVSMTFVVEDATQPDSTGYTTTVTADRRQG